MNDADPKKGGAVAKKMLEDAGLPVTDENIFIAASCKEKGILFLKDPSKAPMGCRFAEEAKPAAGKGGPVTVTINGKAYGVEIKGDGKAVVNGKPLRPPRPPRSDRRSRLPFPARSCASRRRTARRSRRATRSSSWTS